MRIVCALTVILILLLTGCTHDEGSDNNSNRTRKSNANGNPVTSFSPPAPIEPTENPDPSFKSCNAYYPLIPGSETKYSLLYASGLKADAIVVVDKLPDQNGNPVFSEKTQIVDVTGGLHKNSLDLKQYMCDAGKLQFLSRSEDNEVDGNKTHLDLTFTTPAIAFVEPTALKQGTSWSYAYSEKFQTPNGPVDPNKKYNVLMSVMDTQDLTVPAGTFKTLKVEKRVDTTIIYEYYARGVGLVKRVLGDGTTWELREFSGVRAEE